MKKDDKIGRFECFKRLRFDRPTDRPTNQPTNQPTEKGGSRDMCMRLKTARMLMLFAYGR